MADERLLDEEQYFRTRAGQLVAEAERRGISRRALLTATAAGLPLLAGTCRARASAHQPGGQERVRERLGALEGRLEARDRRQLRTARPRDRRGRAAAT
jgi:hypothetical protein